MKFKIFVGFFCWFFTSTVYAQDTFSIVATDPETGEVGSAGASCVDLSIFSLPPDFLGELFPGVGAINTQAFYLSQNQANARIRMQSGDTPQQIIQWLIANDADNNPTIRQYGVVRIINDESFSAAHTGDNTDDYTGDLTGDTYSIQGNILLGPQILEEMEQAFLNTEGDLAQRLMAAMQGANVPGADIRCLGNETSSLFAFLKVAQPGDNFGQPSLNIGVSFNNGISIEPIDSLQSMFDELFPTSVEDISTLSVQTFPNPARDQVVFEFVGLPLGSLGSANNQYQLGIYDTSGRQVYRSILNELRNTVYRKQLGTAAVYVYKIQDPTGVTVKTGKVIFQ